MCTEKGMEEHILNLIVVISREQNLQTGERLSVFSHIKTEILTTSMLFFLPLIIKEKILSDSFSLKG